MSREERQKLGNQVLEMFDHAYGNYMEHAYPADELMPLTCRGRVRGQEPSRGDVDDALGKFSLTLIDSLDTLVGSFGWTLAGDHAERKRRVHAVVQ